MSQVSSANSLIADEYLKDAKSPEDIRDGLTEVIGDLLMALPVLNVAGYHTGQREASCENTDERTVVPHFQGLTSSLWLQMWELQCTCMNLCTAQRYSGDTDPAL